VTVSFHSIHSIFFKPLLLKPGMKMLSVVVGVMLSLPLVPRAVSAPDIDFGNDTSWQAHNGKCDDPRFSSPGSTARLFESDRFRDATDCSELYQSGQVQLVTDTRGAALPLQGGRTQQGRLESGAAYPDRYRYQGSAGTLIVVDLQALDFFGYLTLVRPSGERLSNGDSDDLNRTRLKLALTETGEHQVEVAGYDTTASGAYRLTLNQFSVAADHHYDDSLASTDAIADKGGYIDTWRFEGQAGQLVSIELGSDDFNTFVVLNTPDGSIETNQFSACRYQGCSVNYDHNSLIERELTVPGTYTVRITSRPAGETGAYHLRIAQYEKSN
jgi:hypothetical protein